jgi:hypothetical protein
LGLAIGYGKGHQLNRFPGLQKCGSGGGGEKSRKSAIGKLILLAYLLL